MRKFPHASHDFYTHVEPRIFVRNRTEFVAECDQPRIGKELDETITCTRGRSSRLFFLEGWLDCQNLFFLRCNRHTEPMVRIFQYGYSSPVGIHLIRIQPLCSQYFFFTRIVSPPSISPNVTVTWVDSFLYDISSDNKDKTSMHVSLLSC